MARQFFDNGAVKASVHVNGHGVLFLDLPSFGELDSQGAEREVVRYGLIRGVFVFGQLDIECGLRAELPRGRDVFSALVEHGQVVDELGVHIEGIDFLTSFQT